MARGGARPGAGRPKGSKSQLTLQREAVAAKALTDGITPLEVMLNTMRKLYDEGEFMAASQVAKDAAPYVHPKLATTDMRLSGGDGGPMVIVTGIPVGHKPNDASND